MKCGGTLIFKMFVRRIFIIFFGFLYGLDNIQAATFETTGSFYPIKSFSISSNTTLLRNQGNISDCPYLKCDPGIRDEWSCTGKKHVIRYCACDRQCNLFHDCCEDSFDKELFLQQISNKSTTNYSNSESDYMLQVNTYSGCFSIEAKNITGNQTKIITVKLINQCPSHYVGNLNAKCSSGYKILNIITSVKSGIHHLMFINPFCALCHGYKKRDMLLWDSSVHCPKKYKCIPKFDIQRLSEHCALVYTLKEEGNLRYCLDTNTSNVSPGSMFLSNKSTDHNLCNGYISLLFDKNEKIYFRNKHCALAVRHNISQLEPVIDSHPNKGVPAEMDMNILFRFTGEDIEISNTANKCSPGLTYDQVTGLCSNLICPVGFFREEQRCIHNESSYEFIRKPKVPNSLETFYRTDVYILHENMNSSFDIEKMSLIRLGVDDTDVFQKNMKHLTEIFSEMNTSSDSFILQNFPPSQSLNCDRGILESFTTDEFSVSWNGSLDVVFKRKLISVPLSRIRFSLTVIITKYPNTTLKFTNGHFYFCRMNNILECSSFLTSYESDTYQIVNNFVYFNLSSTILNSKQYLIINSILYICHTEKTNSEKYTLTLILTLVFFSISLSCLLLSILLQIMIRGIQTCPAKCFLSFSLSWFFAQFGFILPSFLPPEVCFWFALSLHYLWLCIFSWSSVLAFDLVKTLAVCSKTLKREFMNNSLFVRYSVIGWGLPFVIVSVSYTLDINLSSFEMQYGARGTCWVGNADALLLTFIIPTCISTFFNMICLGVSLHGLEIAKKNTQNLQKTQKEKQRWVMYLQMFFFCGGSWILAYVANNISMTWLHITNIVLNGCQGVCILIITTKDSKVRKWISFQLNSVTFQTSQNSNSQTHNDIDNTKI